MGDLPVAPCELLPGEEIFSRMRAGKVVCGGLSIFQNKFHIDAKLQRCLLLLPASPLQLLPMGSSLPPRPRTSDPWLFFVTCFILAFNWIPFNPYLLTFINTTCEAHQAKRDRELKEMRKALKKLIRWEVKQDKY